MSAGHLVKALRYSMASGARRPPAGGLRMEAQRAGTPALVGDAVYDSRPHRGTPSLINAGQGILIKSS